MDRVGIAVKYVIFQKEKSGQVVVYTPLESIHAVCLPQNEIIKGTSDIYAAPKIKET